MDRNWNTKKNRNKTENICKIKNLEVQHYFIYQSNVALIDTYGENDIICSVTL